MSLALMAVFMVSCSNEDMFDESINTQAELSPHRITVEQAKQNALNFVEKYRNGTRANHTSLEISEVKAIGKSGEFTRSSGELINLDSLFYVINFANDEGFVIAASDDREEPVFAYVEEGTFNENEPMEGGFCDFMNALIDNQVNCRAGTYEENILPDDRMIVDDGSNYRPDKFEVMTPLLVTKWGQEEYWGYNRYCPEGTLTGCVPTAMAQICSFLKKPTRVSWFHNGDWGESIINWDEILNECQFGGNPSSQSETCNQIAHLMRFWGVAFDAEYTSDGTGVNSDNAISKIRELGFNATKLTDYNADNVLNDLKKGDRIIYMRGNDDYHYNLIFFKTYTGGHAWVVDGYIHSRKNNWESIYLHCNWGWYGRKNGYFLSSVLDAWEGPAYEDHEVTTRANYHYQYELKTSTISK